MSTLSLVSICINFCIGWLRKSFQRKYFKISWRPKIFVNKNAIKCENWGVRGSAFASFLFVTFWSQFESRFVTFRPAKSEQPGVVGNRASRRKRGEGSTLAGRILRIGARRGLRAKNWASAGVKSRKRHLGNSSLTSANVVRSSCHVEVAILVWERPRTVGEGREAEDGEGRGTEEEAGNGRTSSLQRVFLPTERKRKGREYGLINPSKYSTADRV